LKEIKLIYIALEKKINTYFLLIVAY